MSDNPIRIEFQANVKWLVFAVVILSILLINEPDILDALILMLWNYAGCVEQCKF